MGRHSPRPTPSMETPGQRQTRLPAPRRACAVKEGIGALGRPTNSGFHSWKNDYALTDAPLVAQIKAAGGIILGKASLSEFTNSGGDNINSVRPGFCRHPDSTARALASPPKPSRSPPGSPRCFSVAPPCPAFPSKTTTPQIKPTRRADSMANPPSSHAQETPRKAPSPPAHGRTVRPSARPLRRSARKAPSRQPMAAHLSISCEPPRLIAATAPAKSDRPEKLSH